MKNSYLEAGLGVVIFFLLIPPIFWGLVTWNLKNAVTVYMAEVNFVSQPLFALFENIAKIPSSKK